MRLIAKYLPQFHHIPENDAWWGKGFTEWMTVRQAENLFAEQEQPHVPLGHRYYDLMDPETMRWQAGLMHQYGVDGMCFYHYYFKDGRRVLERPTENLLRWKDIDMPFCFSWANESWVRSWSKLADQSGNPWSGKFDEKHEEHDDGMLLEQAYGDADDWRKHYAYLSPFFHDRRYILQDNMPVFLIYKPELIPCIREMLQLWDELAQQEGFDGVFVIGTHGKVPAEQLGLKGRHLPEPLDTIWTWMAERKTHTDIVKYAYDYRDVWRLIVGKPVPENVMREGFVGYDDTPRHEHKGRVIYHPAPEVFYLGMKNLIEQAEQYGHPFVFINAWNEWGEGMHLEPDERYGYAFLEALKKAREDAGKASAERETSRELRLEGQREIARIENERLQKRYGQMQERCDRYRSYWTVLDRWFRLEEQGKSVAAWLRSRGIGSIAVYGLGMLGQHLLAQLATDAFPVLYGIDRKRTEASEDLPVYAPDDVLPEVEAILIAVSYDVQAIQANIEKHTNARILTLDGVLRAMEEGEQPIFELPERDARRYPRGCGMMISMGLSRTGAPIVLYYAARILQAHGYEIVVVAHEDGPLRAAYEARGIPVQIDPGLAEPARRIGRLDRLPLENCDFVWVNTALFAEIMQHRQDGVPVLWWIHEAARWYKGIHTVFDSKDWENVHIRCVSPWAKQNFSRHIACPDGVAACLPYGIPDEAGEERAHCEKNGKLVFAVVGTLSEIKGQAFFLHAWKNLSVDAVELWIIGHGNENNSEVQEVHKAAKGLKNVKFLGELDHDALLGRYRAMDVLVCPSTDDQLPVVATEAMMFGKPCLVSDHTGTASFIEHGVNGWVFRSGDAGDLAEKLQEVIAARDSWLEMGECARECYERHFSYEAFEKRVLDEAARLMQLSRKVADE